MDNHQLEQPRAGENPPVTNASVFARGLPECILITETYRYHQRISSNTTNKADGDPEGALTVKVAYDGHRSFTPQALLDVQHQLGADQASGGRAEALIGHLAFANHYRTTIARELGMAGQYNTLPLAVPVEGKGIWRRGALTDDRHTWVATCDYDIEEPKVWPIALDIRVRDEDTVWPNIWDPEIHSDSLIKAGIVRTIVSQLRARHDLAVALRVGANLPAVLVANQLHPVARQIKLQWPRITSLRSFSLNTDQSNEPDLPYMFDPMNKSLVWYEVAMPETDDTPNDALRSYRSPGMTLTIRQAGELHREEWEPENPMDNPSETLSGEIVVDISDWLLSGIQVRLFDGLGELVQNPPIKLMTRLVIKFDLILDDAFSRRRLSPRQHLYFDQVIPDDMRLLDVRTALADRGFRVLKDEPLELKENRFGHYLVASRPEGPDSMLLWLVMEGKEVPAERQSRIAGGHRYTSTFDSGELILYVVGELPGNAHVLTRELNALQQALRERFNRLQSRR